MKSKKMPEAPLERMETEYKNRICELEARVEKLTAEKSTLIQSEQMFKAIVENSQDYIMLYDREIRHLYENPAALKIAGFKEEDIIGKTHREAGFDKELCEYWEEIIGQVFCSGESREATFKWEGTDGPIFLNLRFFPKFNENGEVEAVIGVSRDLTEAKHMEKILSDSNMLLLEVERMANIGSWQWDIVTNEFDLSEQWQKIHGVTKPKLTMDELVPIAHSEDSDAVNNAFQGVLSGVNSRYDIEHRIIRQDNGKTRFVRAIGEVAKRNDSGEPLRMFGFAQDITEQKEAEFKINESIREKEILLKEIHHRVKNNLQVISSLLSLQAHSDSDQHTVEVLEESQRRIKIMANLHETLYQSDKMGSINIRNYLDSVIKDMLSSFNRQEVKISCQIDIEQIDFSVSQSMALGQILGELLSNCFKHAFAGRQNGNIKVKLNRIEDEKFEMVVTDDGKGFPNNFNLQDTKTLGLKLVRGLAQQLHGELSIDTTQNTCIRITMTEKPI